MSAPFELYRFGLPLQESQRALPPPDTEKFPKIVGHKILLQLRLR